MKEARSTDELQPGLTAGKRGIDERTDRALFPIVGIGASAGGLEAFRRLLKSIPPDSGMGFVLVQHLAPRSILTELLSRETSLPVTEVKDRMQVEANHVYVIPPNANMVILNENKEQ